MATALAPTSLSRADWLTWRRSGLGGSDAPVVAGISPYKSRVQLFLEKTGKANGDIEPSMPMMWGNLLEPAIASRFAERTGVKYAGSQVCFQSDVHPWQLATLDRLTTDNAIVELKAVGHGKVAKLGEDGDTDSLPDEWILQSQHQMGVTGLELVFFAVFVGTYEDIRIYEVPRNDQLIESLTDLELEFWSHVQSLEPPPVLDMRDAEELAKLIGTNESRVQLDPEISVIVDRYQDLGARISELEKERGQRKGQILSALNGAGYGELTDGRVVKCSVIDVAERIQQVKAHKQLRLSFRGAKL